MVYTPPTFVDVPDPNNPPAGAVPLNAATLNPLAQAAAAGANNSIAAFGTVSLDTFAGADDDTKLGNALAAVAADTYKRTILLGNRKHTFANARAAFSGMRIAGPGGYSNADKGAAYMAAEVHLTMSGAWFTNNAADVFDVDLRQLAFTGGSGATVLGNGTDTSHSWWRLHMRDISSSGLKNVLGTQSQALLATGAFLDGFWEINNSYNSAFHIGGSDNRLFVNGGFLDSGTAFNSAPGQAHLWLDYCDNTTVGPLYITCEGPWRGVQIDGPGFASTSSSFGGPASFYGLQIEGRNISSPCYGANVRQNGGITRFRDCNVNYGMSNAAAMGTSDVGLIHHAGGQMIVDGMAYDRATGVAETVPLVYTASAGKCLVSGIQPIYHGGTWTGLPRVGIKSGNAENRITDATVSLVTI